MKAILNSKKRIEPLAALYILNEEGREDYLLNTNTAVFFKYDGKEYLCRYHHMDWEEPDNVKVFQFDSCWEGNDVFRKMLHSGWARDPNDTPFGWDVSWIVRDYILDLA